MTSQASLPNLLIGALVSDAASLGVHWLYEPDRIAQISNARDGSAAFVPVDEKNYENTKGYFAHSERRLGMLTQYGESLYLAIKSMDRMGGVFDPAQYQTQFSEHFGPGGRYCGYIDRPTRGTLENIAKGILTPSGVDDDQLPALSRLPAILAGYLGTPHLETQAIAAMEVTNVNAVAAGYTRVFVDLFMRLQDGHDLGTALIETANAAPEGQQALLLDALRSDETNSTIYGEKTGRACHLPMAGPLIFHILKHATSYRDAVERNLLAGGDNAGRSLMIGAVMAFLHGIDTPQGIPMEWVLKTERLDHIWEASQRLVHAKS